MKTSRPEEIALTPIISTTGDISPRQLTLLLILLLIPYVLGIYWKAWGLIYLALLAPPLVCLVIGMLDPAAGITLGLAILPLLTVEVAIAPERSVSVAKLIFLIIIAIWLFTRKLKSFPVFPLLPHWIIYIFALFISSSINGLTFPILWNLAESVIIFLVFVAVTEIIQNDEQREKVLHLLAISGSMVIILWLVQKGLYHWGTLEIPLVLRVGIVQLTSMRNSSTLAQPNYFAAYCILLGSIFFSLAVGKARHEKLGIAPAGIGIWTIPLWLTSAGAIISLAIVLTAGGILFRHNSLKFSALIGLLILATVIGTNLFSQSSIFSSLAPESNSILVRKYAIKLGYRAWLDNPLFGSGPGTFENEFLRAEKSYSGPKLALYKPARSLAAHNSYLRHLVETGIFGLAASLWLLLGLFAHLWKKLRNNGLSHTYLFLGLLAFAISATFEDIFSYSVLWAIFWSANTLILGNHKFDRLENS